MQRSKWRLTYVSRNVSDLSNSHSPNVGEQSVQKQTTNLMCSQQNLTDMLGKLTSRIESLEDVLNQRKPDVSVVCKNCNQPRHYARGCAYDRSRHLRKSRGHRRGNQVRRDGHTCPGTQSGIVKDVSNIITISSVSKYSLNVYINGICVLFLVDTGAAASLIDGKVWDSIKVLSDTLKLNPVNTRFVGVDGVPLQVRGSAVIGLSIQGLIVNQKVIVADSLTSQGILGMDFLESNHCTLDLSKGMISTGGKNIPLDPHHGSELAVVNTEVSVEETFTIAALSEMEIMGNIDKECRGTWLVEDRLSKKQSILVARALVTPQQGRVPIRVLNLNPKPLTVYKGTKIAKGESVGLDISAISVFSESCDWEAGQSVVEKLMENMTTDLDHDQHGQVSALLARYAYIFASKSSDLGRTNVLTHRIETTGAPIRQGIRRVPPPQQEEVRKLLDELKEKGIISPSKSPWASLL